MTLDPIPGTGYDAPLPDTTSKLPSLKTLALPVLYFTFPTGLLECAIHVFNVRSQTDTYSQLNPLRPNSSNYYTLPYRPNLPFFNFWHSGTLALSPERQSARMSEIKNGRLSLYGAEHSKCDRVMTLGFKGLSSNSTCSICCTACCTTHPQQQIQQVELEV